MMKTITMPVKGLNFAGCAREIEKRLGKIEAIKSVEASYVSQIATITYDPAQLSEEHLRAMVKDRGFACGEPLLATRSAIIAEPGRSEDHMPLSPMSSALSKHAPASPDQHEDTASFPIQHLGGMDHDMSDPVLARAMEVDMRTRFFVALVLTIPVVPYSSLGLRLFGVHVPTPFGVNPNWVLLILSTPIVWWCGWMFHAGAWRALRNHTLDMNVLVSLGVLVAIGLSKATVTKMKQNLFCAAIYDIIAIPIAAGVLCPLRILLASEVGALAMSASSIPVATNAVLLKGVDKTLSGTRRQERR